MDASARSDGITMTQSLVEASDGSVLLSFVTIENVNFIGSSGDDDVSLSNVTGGQHTASLGDGDDTINGGDGGDIFDGGAGDDNIRTGSGDDTLIGGDGNDTLQGGSGDDRLVGGAGNDYVSNGPGMDVVVVGLGMGNDTVADFDLAQDMVEMTSLSPGEQSLITYLANGGGDRVMVLSDGSSLTFAGLPASFDSIGDPMVTGTVTEDETLTADTSAIQDANGLGTFSYQWLRDGADISGATGDTYMLGQADVGSHVSVRVSYTDGVGTVESMTSSPVGPVSNVNDAPTGMPTILGGTSIGDTLTADASAVGDEDGLGTFSASWLRDGVQIPGATGSTYILTNADAGSNVSVRLTYTDGRGTVEALTSNPVEVSNLVGVVFPGTSGPDTFFGGMGDDTVSGLEGADLLTGGMHDDQITGHQGNDTLYGGSGDDTLSGLADNDFLGGGEGDDSMLGGAGDDDIYGSNGNDTADGGFGNDILGGSSGDDSLSGNVGNDEVWGAGGNDTLSGGDGNDTVGGSVGNDFINGDGGDDELWGADGSDTLDGGAGDDQVGAGIGDDTVRGGDGNDGVFGGQGNDLVEGGSGNDSVFGAGGNDTVDGGAGNDTLFAGPGADVIIFSPGMDRLEFFLAAEDEIDLSGAVGIADFIDLSTNHLSEVSGNAVITDASGNTLTIVGTPMAALAQDDFSF